MIKMGNFLLASILLLTTGCTITTKNMVGLQEYKLDPQQIDGTWINADGALALKVTEANKGIVRVFILEDKEKPEIFNIRIMKGKSSLYFNVLPEGNRTEIYWGKIKIEKNTIVAWHPFNKPFLKAIEEGKLLGTTKPAAITDTANNIVDLVESSENVFFQWEEPLYLMKLTK